MITGRLEPIRQLKGKLMTVVIDNSLHFTGSDENLREPDELISSDGTIEKTYTEVMGQAPLQYDAGSSRCLEELVIDGNVGGVGEMINYFDKDHPVLVALYPYSTNGVVVDGSTTGLFSRSLLLEVEPNTTYTFYISKQNGDNITNRIRIAGYAEEPRAQMNCTFLGGAVVWVGDHATSTFTTTADTHYLLAFLWSGNEYTEEFVENVIQTRELQLEKGAEISDYAPYGRCRIPVKVTGKNLFDPGRADVVNGGTLSGSWQDDGEMISILFPCKENTNYAVTKASTNRMSLSVYRTYPEEGDGCIAYAEADNTATSCVINSGSGAQYLSVLLASGALTEEEREALLASIQIEESSQPTGFAPYTEQTITFVAESPLEMGESIVLSETEKSVPIFEGKNTLTVETAVQPYCVYVKYN